MGFLWWLLNWTTLWIVLFLGWSYLCFRAGFWARGEEDLTRWLHKIIPEPPDDDEPPERVRT